MEDKKGYEGDFVPRSSRKRYGYSLRLPLTLKPRVQKAARLQERSVASYMFIAVVEKLDREEYKKYDGDLLRRSSTKKYNYPLRLPSFVQPRVKQAAKKLDISIAAFILIAIVEKLERDERN